ncbi:exonuclease, partial [Halomonas litopenaei]|nr:exonuclease [Halomonas litopenaei]
MQLQRPFSESDWQNEILDKKSSLLAKAREQYLRAVAAQADVCEAIFRRPLAVVTGAAGTGKTTVISAIIRAVRQTEGDGAPVTVMAPTGKASDRVRAKLYERGIDRVETSTVHSFLAKGGWLNNNLTFRRSGGKREGGGT